MINQSIHNLNLLIYNNLILIHKNKTDDQEAHHQHQEINQEAHQENDQEAHLQ
jgi:hypothetical protein